MSDVLPDLEGAIAEYGTPMTLRRRVGITGVWTAVPLKGLPRTYTPGELVGGIQQGDQRILIGTKEMRAANWPMPPAKNDQIVIEGGVPLTVQGAWPRRLGSTILAFELWARG